MIKFRCKSCNQKIAAQDKLSGKRVRCPKCKNIVVVPKIEDTSPATSESDSSSSKISSTSSGTDLTLLDIPQKDKTADQPKNSEHVSDRMLDDLQKLEEKLGIDKSEPTEPVGKRKLPWLIDIFLYPTSIQALVTLGAVFVIPPLVNIVLRFTGSFILIFFWFGLLIDLGIYLYAYWYFCESIRDSAEGGLRAPDRYDNTPGLGEIFGYLFKTLVCLAFFFLPMIIYLGRMQKPDLIFWFLFGYGVIFFPMGLLAVIILDSFSGLNPISLIGSIFSTLIPYSGIVMLFCGLGWLLGRIWPIWWQSRIPGYISLGGFAYLALVAAHLLGRFYWRYQKELNWEV